MPPKKTTRRAAAPKQAESYQHKDTTSPMRPEVGAQAQFKKKLPPQKYRYDSSLSPALDWDSQNPARERGEWLLACIEEASALQSPHKFPQPKELRNSAGEIVATAAGLLDATAQLRALGKPFLNWTGKAERLSFDVPSMPLFIHERLSTKAILETLKGHKRDKQTDMFDLFGDPGHSTTDQVLRAYEYQDAWVNRMMLGDSLVVMNSLLRYEGMGGKVQMIYMDPPYGVKFGSNFQPFVRKRGVKHNEDAHMTREPEMVQAYRDTWELGTHSYLTYLRDRLLIARDLLAETGSIFVQIGEENIHFIRSVLDDVFGPENFLSQINYATTGGFETVTLSRIGDHLIWFAKDKKRVKYRPVYLKKSSALDSAKSKYDQVELSDHTRRPLSDEDFENGIPEGSRIFRYDTIVSQNPANQPTPFTIHGKTFTPPANSHWKPNYPEGMNRLAEANRVAVTGESLSYVRYLDDLPVQSLNNVWTDLSGTVQSRSQGKIYAVQTSTTLISRCLLMATDPGDLVLDPTCGSGTTAYVSEQWGRRWITCDTSRVPLALARQRLLTATFPWHELKDTSRGPGAGFVYKRKQNKKGEEIGGIVPHVTLESISKNEPPEEEILVDRPESDDKITRVTGAFCVEATIPTPMEWEEQTANDVNAENIANFPDRMLEVLRRVPVLRLEGNRTVTLKNVRPMTKSLSLHAEAMVDATATGQTASLTDAIQESAEKSGLALPLSQRPVAFVFGPENGAVSTRLVEQAAREASGKHYTHLYVIGFAIQPNARESVEQADHVFGVPATYVQATPDLMMGDLLKNMRSSQIFSVCGLPEIAVRKMKKRAADAAGDMEVELIGLDVFDPVTMEVHHRGGNDVPAWFLDTDYNGMCFHVSQAFFPRTSEWDKLKKALKGEFEDSVWDHLSGTVSAPFDAGEQKQIAVKVIDDRGNELMVVKKL